MGHAIDHGVTARPKDGLELPGNARALLHAVVAISSDLDLHSVLNRIVVSACEITGARYGALGVIGHGGTLVDFVTHGLSQSEHDALLRASPESAAP